MGTEPPTAPTLTRPLVFAVPVPVNVTRPRQSFQRSAVHFDWALGLARRCRDPRHDRAKLRWLEELRNESLHCRQREARRSPARARKASRPRAAREAARSGLVRRARSVRAPSRGRVRDAREPAVGRRRRHRLRDDLRAQGLRLLAGLHGLRRLAVARCSRRRSARSWTWP